MNQFVEGTRGDEVDLSQAYQAVWWVPLKKGLVPLVPENLAEPPLLIDLQPVNDENNFTDWPSFSLQYDWCSFGIHDFFFFAPVKVFIVWIFWLLTTYPDDENQRRSVKTFSRLENEQVPRYHPSGADSRCAEAKFTVALLRTSYIISFVPSASFKLLLQVHLMLIWTSDNFLNSNIQHGQVWQGFPSLHVGSVGEFMVSIYGVLVSGWSYHTAYSFWAEHVCMHACICKIQTYRHIHKSIHLQYTHKKNTNAYVYT